MREGPQSRTNESLVHFGIGIAIGIENRYRKSGLRIDGNKTESRLRFSIPMAIAIPTPIFFEMGICLNYSLCL
jgi:hypothetical protein